MGLAASQSRYLVLTARKSDLELTGQQINQSRLQLANVTNDLFNVATTLDPDSPEAIRIQLRINALQSLDQSFTVNCSNVTMGFVDAGPFPMPVEGAAPAGLSLCGGVVEEQ